jgi:UDP-N-acetylglucosamine 4,6-dehydratase
MLDNKTLLITGGTGSFGKAVLNEFLETGVKEVRIFSRDELKQEQMRIAFNHPKLKFYIGDVRSYDSIHQAMKNVDYVFHAAALKQVPSCEFYPMEAVATNVLGSENVMKAASAQGVERVILLSTDKAVYPINAMGISKALMEKFMVAKARTQNEGDTIFCATRYGNVMASRGSVIPLFISQLRNKQPITLTDPNMTRFLMSLSESVDLVKYAFAHGTQGDIFVRKAPAATVQNLATALSELFDPQAEFRSIGTRHGEKKFETLISREERLKSEDLGNYFRISADDRDLNYAQYFTQGTEELASLDDYTSHNTEQLSVSEIKEHLLSLSYVQEQLNA